MAEGGDRMAAMKEDNGSLKMYLGEMKEFRKVDDNQAAYWTLEV